MPAPPNSRCKLRNGLDLDPGPVKLTNSIKVTPVTALMAPGD